MKIVIDISKDRYDEIMSMDWKNCRLLFDEEIRAIHDGKALEQEPCDDAISRQAVLDLVADYDLSMGQVVKGIHNLPPVTPKPKMDSSSEKPSRWIPVSERLPDTLKEVIIAFANEPDEYDIAYLRTTSNKTYIANGSKKEWVSSMGETTYAEYEVDAWMPIIPYQSEIPTGAEGSDKND